MDKLTFNKTVSLAFFKTEIAKDAQLQGIKSPKTGKLFFVCGDITGAISNKFDQAEPAYVSAVTGEDGDFYMLHNKTSDNAVFTL